jgi:hypothetical protein
MGEVYVYVGSGGHIFVSLEREKGGGEGMNGEESAGYPP